MEQSLENRKLSIADLKLFASIVVYVVALVLSYAAINEKISLIQKDIALIQGNHLVHIQDSIKDICDKNEKQDEAIKEIDIKLERILTIIDAQKIK